MPAISRDSRVILSETVILSDHMGSGKVIVPVPFRRRIDGRVDPVEQDISSLDTESTSS